MNTPHPNEQDKILRGSVRRITYQNPTNNYTVIQLALDQGQGIATVVGYPLITLNEGTHVVIRGNYISHKKFGLQFQAESFSEVLPSSKEGILNYLGSGYIKGVGAKSAERLVEAFGEKTLEIITKNPEKIAELIGPHKATLLKETFDANESKAEVVRFLLEHNLTEGVINKILKAYGLKAVEIISKDPYILARDPAIQGIGFKKADEIGKKLKFDHLAPQRIRAAIHYLLLEGSDEGHVFLPKELLFARAMALLGIDDESLLPPCLEELVKEGSAVEDDQKLYLPFLYQAEVFVSEAIALWVEQPLLTPIPETMVTQAINQTEAKLGVTLSEDQKKAVTLAANNELLLLTGGPGCGKTTTIQALTNLFKLSGKRLFLAAPTGRAAQRMSQVTGMPASTIHRLLKYDPFRKSFLYCLQNPLPADAIIIDETSMVDILLAKDLLSAIPSGCHVIFVGDKDQLPSVGPGKFFAELLALDDIASIRLMRLFRRGEASLINEIAHQVNSGHIPSIPEPDGVTKTDAYYIPRESAEDASNLVERLVTDIIPRKFDITSQQITVLTPSNRGPLGTILLNEKLQEKLNPSQGPEAELILKSGAKLRLGDKVSQRVNNYELDTLGVFNGDSGTIVKIDSKSFSIQVELWDGRLINYASSELWQLQLCYAMTVHRSQGSEIPCVLLVLHTSHFTLLERQLIYTGITRAKKLLVVVGARKALEMAARRTSAHNRCSHLTERILTAMRNNRKNSPLAVTE